MYRIISLLDDVPCTYPLIHIETVICHLSFHAQMVM